MSDDGGDLQSPGWDAIDEALHPLYGGVEPMHWGTVVPWALGGPDPIQGVSAYRGNHDPPHWHYVTYGFTELYDKESDDPTTSGYGFELTIRVAREADEEPPIWVVGLLQNLGRYVFRTGNTFGPGHTMPLNGPIRAESDTLVRNVAFVADPELPAIETPNGSVEFLQLVGLTDDELDAIHGWNAARFLELCTETNPWLVTDLMQRSRLEDSGFEARVSEAAAAEGASSGWLYYDAIRAEPSGDVLRIVFGALVVDNLNKRLLGRIPFDRDMMLRADETWIRFEPGALGWQPDNEGWTITLGEAEARTLAALLEPRAGTYRHDNLPGLEFVVEPTSPVFE